MNDYARIPHEAVPRLSKANLRSRTLMNKQKESKKLTLVLKNPEGIDVNERTEKAVSNRSFVRDR